MDDGPRWFAPKRLGMGIGPPVSWQGWVVTLAFSAIVIGSVLQWRDQPPVLAAVLVPVVITFLIIGARTTPGGWRWHRGDDD